ncbi:MAG TPA: helix-turn-helix domain-containing protein [Thermoplasmataceae archaeon]|nr:helix-turn-helix domain-containing protein [Thermoplasmatales archaeon AK]HLH86069.1 helix-turn-helix domain-containing protein [Thermoplasmataceae archaeon]
MVNVFFLSINQHDCPHTYLTDLFPSLRIFIMNTEAEGNYQTTFSVFFSRDSDSLNEAFNELKKYGGIRNIEVIGKKDNLMSLIYSFPKTSAFRHINSVGFRMHPIFVKNGEERWFFVTSKSSLKLESDDINDSRTSIRVIKKLTTDEFVTEYSKIFTYLWKIKFFKELDSPGPKLLTEALNTGYYDWPRKVSLTQLSKAVNIPRATLTYRLRKLEKTIFNDLVADDMSKSKIG